MAGSWPKIIRDPVHNIVPFDNNPCDRLLLSLINTKEFQRLRRIKQLGVSHLVFPGADHTRFAHSIGVMQIARTFLDRIERDSPSSIDEDQRAIVLVAALLHDVGHGPFSHAFEKITGDQHEKRTLEIICDSSTEVGKQLREYDSDLPQRLEVFFDEDMEEEQRNDAELPAYLIQIVTSQLDADRFDYLLRDSYSTGTDYGRFDIDWLLQHLHVDGDKHRFYLGSKAMFSAESYVFARYHMYRSVYFHKTTRAAEVMLRLLFRRYKKLLDDCSDDVAKKSVVPEAPPACRLAFTGSIELGEYLLLDDHTLTEFAKACTKTSDSILKQLAEGLLYRRLFKAVDASNAPAEKLSEFTEVELSIQSEPVQNLTKRYKLLRYCFPADVRDKIRTEAEPLLGGN